MDRICWNEATFVFYDEWFCNTLKWTIRLASSPIECQEVNIVDINKT